MKTPLHYSIVPTMYGPRIVAVTTVRGSHWWGRTSHDDVGTHGSLHGHDAPQGEFASLREAELVRDEVQRVRDHFHGERSKLDAAHRDLHQAEQALQQQVMQGSPVRDARWLVATVSMSELKREPES